MNSKTMRFLLSFLALFLAAWVSLMRDSAVAVGPDQISWQARSSLPQALSDLGAVASSGYLITLGGQNSSGASVPNIYKAQFNSEGALGSWTDGGSLTAARDRHGVVVYGGRIYLVGGGVGADPLNTVQYAAVDAFGNVGAWQTTTALPQSRYNFGTAVSGNHLYLAGGWDGAQARSEVYAGTISLDGSIPGWSTTAALPKSLTALSLVAASSFLYAIGGINGVTTVNDIYRARVNPDGSLGEWQLVSTLPAVRDRHASVVYNGRLLVIGGRDAAGNSTNTVFASTISGDGSLGAWSTESPLPEALNRHAAVVATIPNCGDVVLVVGGRNGSVYRNSVYGLRCRVSHTFLPLVLRQMPAAPTTTPTPTGSPTRTPTVTRTRTPTPTPTSTATSAAITGNITQNGAIASGILIDLQFYNGSSWSTLMQTTTDSSGAYRFTSVPSLGSGQLYNVAYGNHEGNDTRLGRRQSYAISSFTGGTVAGGSFDIQNIYHASPGNGATVTLPATFCWTRRNVSTDTYYFALWDPNGSLYGYWYNAGSNSCYTLTSLPSGYQFGVAYGWYMAVKNNPVDNYDWGESYYFRWITFQAADAQLPPSGAEPEARELSSGGDWKARGTPRGE